MLYKSNNPHALYGNKKLLYIIPTYTMVQKCECAKVIYITQRAYDIRYKVYKTKGAHHMVYIIGISERLYNNAYGMIYSGRPHANRH